jgi:hypothetical protein
MKEGDQIFLCGTYMIYKYEYGNKSFFSWYHEGKEFLYAKETTEIRRMILLNPEYYIPVREVANG